MGSLFRSTRNTRSILPDSFRLIRSDAPDKLTEAEIQWLIERNVRTVIDLREEQERNRRRCPLETHPQFLYLCMRVTGGSTIPESQEAVPKSYIRMADFRMCQIIDTIWNAETNVLFFCNAGKDRTGVVSALLLMKLGMDREYIIRDYLESGENLREMLLAFAAENPRVDIRVITPKREYLEQFLDSLPDSGT